MATPPSKLAAHPACVWGVIGFTLILVQALYRLTPLALEPLRTGGLTIGHMGLYLGSIAFNAYTEGYRAFQLQVAPRVVARGLYLAQNPRPLHVLLAPFFVTGLFHAERRRMIASWVIYAGIILLVVLVRKLDQPWRGIIDAGVVVGLGWGVVAILWRYAAALAGRPPTASPEVPLDRAPACSSAGAQACE